MREEKKKTEICLVNFTFTLQEPQVMLFLNFTLQELLGFMLLIKLSYKK